jgi:hypothetical protein
MKLLVYFLLLITIPILANLGEDPYASLRGKTLVYTNHYDGDKIGNIIIKVKNADKEDKYKTVVTIKNKFHIRAYLVFTYDYFTKVTMFFNKNGLTYSSAKTNDDGDKFEYFAKLKNGRLKVNNLIKNKEFTIGNFIGLNLNFIQTEKMKNDLTDAYRTLTVMNVERGKLDKLKVKKAKNKTIKVHGKSYKCFGIKWKLGIRTGISYYDVSTGILVKSSVTKKGNTLVIKLKSVK